jgi:glycosyltransferase involved in cell wall biosynthesis
MAEVAPQGLLNPKFGENVQREQARRELRTSLGLPENAFVVMGCGTLDLRKGIDHFASIAREMLKGKHRVPVHFVWVGDGPRWVHSPYHYVQLDLEQSGSWGHVHFIGERSNVEPFFFGADSFLLTSRVDPFPCVIHEAMAAGLPIVTFSENGGAAEALAGGAGIIIPYGRYDKAAEALSLLCEQPELGHSIGQTAQEKVATQFRFETYAEGILQTAENICRRSLRRGLRVFAGERAAA